MPQNPVDHMMHDFAEAAVVMAREFQLELDYSEQSLQQVEHILARLHQELGNWNVAQAASAGVAANARAAHGPSASQVTEMCKLWGAYFGEVVRRRYGGEWSIETYPGGRFATLTLTLPAGKIYPSMKVYRRLTEGAGENVWSFYQSVRARLARQPGARVQ